jgi:hypothetical protein
MICLKVLKTFGGIKLKVSIPRDSKDYLSITAWTTLKQRRLIAKPKAKKFHETLAKGVLMYNTSVDATFWPAAVKADPPAGTTGWTKSFEDIFNNGFDTNKWNNTFWWGNGYLSGGVASYFSLIMFRLLMVT